ncbi:MAG: hypothetical protein GY811_28175 [Myxococcales bacterium]|nr:hypothetical protein [Myxococcales bacterium]
MCPLKKGGYALADDDQACDHCGGQLVEWEGQFEEFEEIDVVERIYRIVRHRRQKYRCACGCAPVTAPGPTRLRGSGFSLLFSITVCVDKWGMHLPHVRQSGEMAALGCPIIEAEAAYPRSSEAIAIMRKLFAIERELPDFRCLEDSAEREAALKIIAASRLEKSRPLMEELAQWMR